MSHLTHNNIREVLLYNKVSVQGLLPPNPNPNSPYTHLTVSNHVVSGLSSAVNPSPRVCCAVLTDPLLLDKTVGPRDTWTRRCDKRFFMSSKKDDRYLSLA